MTCSPGKRGAAAGIPATQRGESGAGAYQPAPSLGRLEAHRPVDDLAVVQQGDLCHPGG